MTFESMFRAIHDGLDPFPWQSRAAQKLVEDRDFISVNVPTASGKTAMIDAALYAAANGGLRRIAFIIDRRVVVDEAYERSLKIVRALEKPALKNFANRLGKVQIVRLRGGVHGDDDWILYPDKVTVLISTVDQIGSRLLHRGYGVSSRMAPLHAGFVGNDALYIIDEAHLSMPFMDTIESARKYGADIRLISMTATPYSKSSGSINLTIEDRANPILKKRLQSSKRAKLVVCSDKEADFVKEVLSAGQQLSKSAKVIGIVVNRVNTARRIHQTLVKTKQHSELLTGRIRPYDRDRLMQKILPQIRVGRDRKKASPSFIVATQTIEVGADIDFDALVTEAAPLDALRQRFGRLDRLGELGTTKCVIIYRPKRSSSGEVQSDLIYGEGINDTWKWLEDVAIKNYVDFGIAAMEETVARFEPPTMELRSAPVLLPAHVSLLSQTGPEAPYMDISPWLHGAQSNSGDVSIIWRADLKYEDIDLWADIVRLRPPLVPEAIELPIYAAKSWLQGLKAQEITDLEGTVSSVTGRETQGNHVLSWHGPDDCKVVFSSEIRPGDTILVPAQYGGCDRYGWLPESKIPVEDIADFCSLDKGRGHVVRLVPGLSEWLNEAEEPIRESIAELIDSEETVDPELGIDKVRVEEAHTHLRRLINEIDHPLVSFFNRIFEIERHPYGVVLRGKIIDDINATLRTGVAVELERHLEGVTQLVSDIASKHPEGELIIRAAKQHDIGKAESRFQTMLHGNPLDAAAGPMLAKSGLRRLSQVYAAYTASGLPRGFRHELASLSERMTNGQPESDTLVRHLIGTHHGYGRPWFPLCSDPDAPGVEHILLGSGWALNFALLLDRYGPWKLAGMELLLRASDARQSRAEQENNNA